MAFAYMIYMYPCALFSQVINFFLSFSFFRFFLTIRALTFSPFVEFIYMMAIRLASRIYVVIFTPEKS